MIAFEPTLASSLADFAHRMGVATLAIDAGRSMTSFENLRTRMDVLSPAAVPHDEFKDCLSRLRSGEPPSREEMVRVGLLTEGRIWSSLLRRDSLPEAEKEARNRSIEGESTLLSTNISEAYRWMREPFLEGFLGMNPARKAVKNTLFLSMKDLSQELMRPVFLKMEGRQNSGSVKLRGAMYFLLNALLAGYRPSETRLVAPSLGNHALSLFMAAGNLGFEHIHFIVPRSATEDKVMQLRKMGAVVEVMGDTLEQAESIAELIVSNDRSALLVSRIHNPLMAVGMGTLGVEIYFSMSALSFPEFSVLCPVGSGSLLAGISAYLSQEDIPCIGVQVQGYQHLGDVFRRKKEEGPSVKTSCRLPTLADSVALNSFHPSIFKVIRENARDVVSVPEAAVISAVDFYNRMGVISEGAAALPLAALLSNGIPQEVQQKPLVLIHTGSNISLQDLDRASSRSQEMRAVTGGHATPVMPSPDDDRPTQPAPAPSTTSRSQAELPAVVRKERP